MRKGIIGSFGWWLSALAIAALLLLVHTPIARAATEAEQTFLNIYFTPDELHVVSTTRSLKSINRIAENVQVITAAEIELLQAHSLAEVLETVSGVAIENRGGPGSIFVPYIQGSSFTQVAAFLDGIPLNNLGNNFPELTFLPVQEVARIEVIKGPASSTWGSALGGVINIITKNAPEADGHAGLVSASAGTAETTDLRAQVAGRVGGFGYALTAGRLDSDGLTDGYAVERTSVTAKLSYRPATALNLGFALYYTGSDRGEGLWPDYDEADRSEANHLRAQATAEGFLPGGALLSFNVWGAHNDDDFIEDSISDGTEFYRLKNEDKMGGAGLRYQRAFAGHAVVLGGDYLTGQEKIGTADLEEQKWALFVNDTFDVGRVTFTAGLRYDDLDSAGSFWSPSLGAVYPLGRHLLLRGYVGRGFTAPILGADISNEEFSYEGNPDLKVETVTSYQGGIEGDAPGLFWYKLTLFRHDVKDGITSEDLDDGNWTYVNKDEVRRQGLEFDAHSVPFHGLAIEGGAAYIDAENQTSGSEYLAYADFTYRVGLSYTGDRGLRALLHVHRTHWVMPADYNPAAEPIVDLLASQKIAVAGLNLEIFGGAHNIFDADQYSWWRFPNPGRWLEAGLRVKF